MNNEMWKKLKNMCMEDRIRLVYEWVKTGKINLRDFHEICESLLLGC